MVLKRVDEADSQRQIIEAQAVEVSRINAETAAEVPKIEADAAKYAGEKEAEINRKLAQSLTETLVQYYYANHWNGELPEYIGTMVHYLSSTLVNNTNKYRRRAYLSASNHIITYLTHKRTDTMQIINTYPGNTTVEDLTGLAEIASKILTNIWSNLSEDDKTRKPTKHEWKEIT